MRAVQLLTPVIVLGLLASPVRGNERGRFEDAKARASYSLGHKTGRDLKRHGVTLNRPALAKGLKDGQSGAKPLMSSEEMEAQLAALRQRIIAALQEGVDSYEDPRDLDPFLIINKENPGVQTTETGLQYKVIDLGTGLRPGPTDRVLVHYRGRTVHGKEFDTTYRKGHPKAFYLDRVIPGWSEGLQLMREGARYELYVPGKLAYTEGSLAYKTLIFEMRLLSVTPREAQQVETGREEN